MGKLTNRELKCMLMELNDYKDRELTVGNYEIAANIMIVAIQLEKEELGC